MIGQRNMEAGYACLFQERYEYGKLLLQDTGVSVMRLFPAHGQFKIYGGNWGSALRMAETHSNAKRARFSGEPP